MKTFLLVITALVVISGLMLLLSTKSGKQENKLSSAPNNATSKNNKIMKIESTAFNHNQPIPSKYTCDGEHINPPLKFFDVPEQTKSLVLIMDDPDAPMGTWVHWTLWNIQPQTKIIAENSVVRGSTEGITSFGKPGYGGPCPPSNTHRYVFKLYALDAKLNLDAKANKQLLEQAMQKHILDQAELIGLYSRR